jgi:uncharacterized glyoxalase superfamily metalloenzyme YdcJ
MGHHEDSYWEIFENIRILNLRKEFNEELEKMKQQEEYKYTTFFDLYQQVNNKVIEKYNKNN